MALNCVIERGRLVADPQLRTIAAETNVCSFRIAVDRDYINKSTGERGTDFFDVCAWGGAANFVAQHFAKGDPILVKGRLESHNWEDKDGNKRISLEIRAENVYFGALKRDSGDAAETQREQPTLGSDESDEELPF